MKKHVHFIGIGGIGMSALARIALGKGARVSGSDQRSSGLTKELDEKGAEVFIGHHESNLKDPHFVVYSTDISAKNPEYSYASDKGIPLLHRSEFLAQLMEGHAPILVTGTHGKTTTSSLLAHVLLDAGLDPTYALGGVLQGHEVNGHFGRGMYLIAEADESDGSFLKYPSFGAIITNLEKEHMPYWETEAKLQKAFVQFGAQVGSKNHLFWCQDDPNLAALDLPGFSYGFSDKADLKIDNFRQREWMTYFDLSFQGSHYQDIALPLIGAHNVLNAGSVFGMGLKVDISEEKLRKAFLSFKGIKRRMEHVKTVGTVDIYDDYAHHPTEIFATLRAFKMAKPSRSVIAIYQPHRYTRCQDCLLDFEQAFEYADLVIVTDIYAASEDPIPGISGKAIAEQIGKQKLAIYISQKELLKELPRYIKPHNLVITMGAGDITQLGKKITL